MDGAGNINVNAPKNMSFTAGENVLINAGNNIVASAQKKNDIVNYVNVNILAGEDITETANDDYNLTASNIIETAEVF